MAPEAKKNPLSSMDTKQKAMAGVIAVIFLFVLWQVIGMLGIGKSAPPPPPPPTVKASPPGGSPQAPLPAMAGGGGMTPAPEMAGGEQPVVQQGRVKQSDFLSQQQEAQSGYLKALNQLQMLKIEKEIEETNQAIAAAQLATASANKSRSDLLAKPLPPPPSAYANQLTNPTQTGLGGIGVSTLPPPPPQPQPQQTTSTEEQTQYVVISVSMEMNKWTAVIGTKGEFFNVAIGDVLPADGAIVADINRNGVILKKNGKLRKVSLISSI